MFYVESSNFYDDLMSGKMQMLNKQGIDEVIKIIRFKENIIKEVREYINNHQLVFELSSKKQIVDWYDMFYKELLEILDKENK